MNKVVSICYTFLCYCLVIACSHSDRIFGFVKVLNLILGKDCVFAFVRIFNIISLESLTSESLYPSEILRLPIPILFVNLVFLGIQRCRYHYREKRLRLLLNVYRVSTGFELSFFFN